MKTENRGGKREGAGRPFVGPDKKKVQISVSVSPATREKARAMKAAGVNVNTLLERHINEMAEEWL